MAPKVTSSSDRSKRKAKTTVTSDKGRKNRSSVSKAQVTESGKGVKPGSAKVTTGGRGTQAPRALPSAGQTKGSPIIDRRAVAQQKLERQAQGRTGPSRVARPQGSLPPGKQGGPLATTGNSKPENPRRTSARNRQAQAAQGTRGPNRTGQPAGSANRQYGANVVNDAVNRAIRQTGRAKALGRGIGIAGVVGPMIEAGIAATDTKWGASVRRGQQEQADTVQRATDYVTSRLSGGKQQSQPRNGRGGSGRPGTTGGRSQGVSTSWQGPTPSPNRGRKPTPTPTPSPTPTRSSGSSSSGGGGGRSYSSPSPSPAPSRSSSPAPTPTPSPKPEASKTGGGAYGKDGKQLYMADKKNNPLMKRTFGYQTGEGPKAKDGNKGPVSGVGPVASGEKYAAKVGQNRGNKMTGGRAAVAGSSAASSSGQANRERDLLKRLAEMKKRQQG